MGSSGQVISSGCGRGGGKIYSTFLMQPACCKHVSVATQRTTTRARSSLFAWLLLSSLALLLLSATLTQATSHSGDLCGNPEEDISNSDSCSLKEKTVKMPGDGERERTFIMVKPDGVQRGLVGEIIKRFEQKGFHLVSMKFMWVSGITWRKFRY